MTADFDLAVIGSGFGGSLLSMIAARLGLRVILLERGRHPRFAIGESASPLAGVVLEQLADRYDLPAIRPLASYGEWRRRYPALGCGLKRGFTYFKQEDGRRFVAAPERTNQLLVAASPSDELADTHWLRADVDHFLVRQATMLGVDYEELVTIDAVEWRANGDALLRVVPAAGDDGGSTSRRVTARFVVDASGPHGALARLLRLDTPAMTGFPPTQALYSHFVDVARCADMAEYQAGDHPPYAIDAAALHHVFDEGWMWVLRFDNGVTSAGVAVNDTLAMQLRLSEGEPAWRRLLARYPSIGDQFSDARAIRPFTWMPRIAWRTAVAAGERWALLPSAAAFVDPLFSTGMPLTLLGIERLAERLQRGPDAPASTQPDQSYSAVTLREADHTARFVAGCYAGFPRFEQFTSYAMFYFVAASFNEMARRLHVPGCGFLGGDDDAFAAAMMELSPSRQPDACVTALSGGSDYARRIANACARLNVAGLCDPGKRNWYAADLDDVVRGAAKLGVLPTDVQRLLAAFITQGA